MTPEASTCPFCAHQLAGDATWAQRVGRYASVAAVAVLTLGCPAGGGSATIYGGPPPKDSPRAPDDAAAEAAPPAPSAQAPDAGADAAPKREHSTIYGAPPVPRR